MDSVDIVESGEDSHFGFFLGRIVFATTGEPWDFEFLEVNSAFEQLTGLDSREIVSRRFAEVFPEHAPDERDLIELYASVATDRRPRQRKRYFPEVDRIFRVHVYSPEYGQFSVIFEPETPAETLRRERHFSQAVIQNLPVGFIMTDSEGRQVDVNEVFCRMTGFTRKELIGEYPPYCYWPDEHRNKVYDAYRRSRDTGIESSELVFRRRNGERFPVLVDSSTLRDDAGKITYHFATIRDISDRKIAENALARQNEFEKIISAVSTDFVDANADNLDKKIGGMLERVCGFLDLDRMWVFQLSRPVLIGEGNTSDVTTTNTHEWCAPGISWQQNAIQDVPFDNFPWWRDHILNGERVHCADPDDLPPEAEAERAELLRQGICSLLSIPLRRGKTVLGYIGYETVGRFRGWTDSEIRLLTVLSDIIVHAFDRVDAERSLIVAKEKAEAADRAKSDFIANMSHEIRTPLNGVIGSTDLLFHAPLNAREKEYVATANNSARALLEIVNDILDFSKIRAGRLELNPESTDIRRLLEDTVDMMALKAARKRIELLLRMDFQLPRYVLVDPIRLKQVLVNLVSNAVKFTDSGEVELAVTATGRDTSDGDGEVQYHFSVRDTGCGIAPEEQARLFEPFSQFKTATAGGEPGTGLGLAITNRIVRKMGSSIGVESEPGTGSRFFFTLPVARELGQPPTPLVDVGEPGTLEHLRRACVVDDTAASRKLLCDLLSRFGIDCHAVSTLDEVGGNADPRRDRASSSMSQFDVVFIGSDSAHSSGTGVTATLGYRVDSPASTPPAVVMYVLSEDTGKRESYTRGDAAGKFWYLQKPVKPSALVSILAEINEARANARRNVVAASPAVPERPRSRDTSEIPSDRKTPMRTRAALSDRAVNVVVADDVAINSALVTAMIRRMLPNASVFQAVDGRRAVEMVTKEQVDCIIMDMYMPNLDGVEATRSIRKMTGDRHTRLPIIGLTADAQPSSLEHCREAGMDDVITKPVDMEKLGQVLREYLL
ncbi:MAG: PAS domain S-box protein [Spirochaetales bacterium]